MEKSNVFSNNKSIESSRVEGPTYGNFFIWSRGLSWVVAPLDIHDISIDNFCKEIVHDGVNSCCSNIEHYNFKMSDFEHVPLNELGLKTIAKDGTKELVLAADGTLTTYSCGIPAQKGFPSTNPVVSGAWVDTYGVLKVPHLSSFDKQTYAMLALVNYKLHFRKSKHLDLHLAIPCGEETGYRCRIFGNGESLNNADYLDNCNGKSIYIDQYPGLTAKHMQLISRNKEFNSFIPFIS